MDHHPNKNEAKKPSKPLTLNQSPSSPIINPNPNHSNPIPTRHVCCIVCLASISIFAGTLILILSLTIFKLKDPSLIMNQINITHFDMTLVKNNHPISANLSLITNISLRNPNIASFKFDNSTTEFYYKEKMIGVAYAPYGKVRAYKTTEINVMMDLLMDRILEDFPSINVLREKDVNLTSFTDIKGRVNLLGVYKREIHLVMNCVIIIGFSLKEVELKRSLCEAYVS
ncbi:hypothetical protein LUZ60_000542 [Juncus effusus]|nr:hypothetical protein LUZ60_000542 [Juncus effusus]